MDSPNEWIVRYGKERAVYEAFSKKIEAQIAEFLFVDSIKFSSESRAKDTESLTRKIEKKGGKYSKLEDITDLSGIRIIVSTLADVEKVAEILAQEFIVDTSRSIDKSKAMEPDRFGYLSQHYIIRVAKERENLREWSPYIGIWAEIQVRTELQHTWSSIQHRLDYKSEVDVPASLRRRLFRMSALFELADQELTGIVAEGKEIVSSYVDGILHSVPSIELNVDSLIALSETSEDLRQIISGIKSSSYVSVDPNSNTREMYAAAVANAKRNGYTFVDELEAMIREMKSIADDYLNAVLPLYATNNGAGASARRAIRPLTITFSILLNYLVWASNAMNGRKITFDRSSYYANKDDDMLKVIIEDYFASLKGRSAPKE